MKKFNYTFTLTLKILIWSAIAVSIVGLMWNIFNLVEYFKLGTTKIVTYSIMVILNVFLLAFTLSVLLFSRYQILNEYLICRIGFITSKCKIQDIVEITYFSDKNVLAVYFCNDKYNLISIKPENFQQFTDALREKNNKIYYNIERDLENKSNS